MIKLEQIALNRAVYPRVGLESFFQLCADLGIRKVELRNDLPGGILDNLSPERVKTLRVKHRIRIITINALQNFNLSAERGQRCSELEEMIRVSLSVEAEGIILCPTHFPQDTRSKEQAFRETVEALKAFRPYFEENNLIGLVEPIGFRESSLRSIVEAMQAVRESGGTNYRTVYDTFHHATGPESDEAVRREYDISYTGLVHVSGVESSKHFSELTDEARVLLNKDDRIGNLEQMRMLTDMGYKGDYSFEPFSSKVHGMSLPAFKEALRESVRLMTGISESPVAPAGV